MSSSWKKSCIPTLSPDNSGLSVTDLTEMRNPQHFVRTRPTEIYNIVLIFPNLLAAQMKNGPRCQHLLIAQYLAVPLTSREAPWSQTAGRVFVNASMPTPPTHAREFIINEAKPRERA
jgi:hypothetical protein